MRCRSPYRPTIAATMPAYAGNLLQPRNEIGARAATAKVRPVRRRARPGQRRDETATWERADEPASRAAAREARPTRRRRWRRAGWLARLSITCCAVPR